MSTLLDLYGEQSPDFIQGFIAAMEYYATEAGRFSLRLYGRPVTREELELEKKSILNAFTENEEEIEI